MAWDFSTDPEFQKKLDWCREFLDDNVLPLETVAYDVTDEQWRAITDPMKQQVKDQDLWACHLDPELGGQGFGQVKLALINEVVGRSAYGPEIFGNQAPDAGNAEMLGLAATEDQRRRWLEPLLAGDLRSGFSMTEPDTAGSDPKLLVTNAILDGDEWVINGRKWFTTQGSDADFLILMAVTNPDVHPYKGSSMIIVPTDTPGVEIVRDVPNMHHPYEGHFKRKPIGHTEIVYQDVRVPKTNIIGEPGEGFVLAQKRLGPGRLHHAMRWIGQAQRAYDMMCERALSRFAHGSLLSEKQMIQDFIAKTRIEIETAKLLCMQAAWHMDKYGSSEARLQISMIKVYGTEMLFNAIDRAIQVHGALGYSTDMPLEEMYRWGRAARLVDGADEVHKALIARKELGQYAPVDGFPTEHVPTRRAAALERFASELEATTANA